MTRYTSIARIVVEAAAPLSIGSGKQDHFSDIILVRDGNGLPAIPGTAFAGALRAAYARHHGAAAAAGAFGSDPNDRELDSMGPAKSQVSVTWGCINDETGNAIEGLLLDRKRIQSSKLLTLLTTEQPVKRDHVRIDEKGTALDGAKFDRGAVPAGARFTFQIEVRTVDDSAKQIMASVLACLADRQFRIGGATRRGYGALKLMGGKTADLDLSRKEDLGRLAEFRQLLTRMPVDPKARKVQAVAPSPADIVVHLEPVDFWRVGHGTTRIADENRERQDQRSEKQETPRGDRGDDRSRQIALQYSEKRINRSNSSIDTAVTLPASGFKGALRHRTFYHLCRLQKCFAATASHEQRVEIETQVATLFGSVKTDGKRKGFAGRVIFSDVVLDKVQTAILNNNGIDRFAGGVRSGILFSEQMIFKGSFDLNIDLAIDDSVPSAVRSAFHMALNDLVAGRLAIGAGASKGYGYCSGKITLGDRARSWFEEGAP